MSELKGQQVLMRVFIGEGEKYQGKPLYQWLVEILKKEKISGATVLRGILGFGAGSQLRAAHILELSRDLPVVIEAVDTPENIERVLLLIGPTIKKGMITTEKVQVIKYEAG
jgi:PII-like signaling protein